MKPPPSSDWEAKALFSIPRILLIASNSNCSEYFWRTRFLTNLSQYSTGNDLKSIEIHFHGEYDCENEIGLLCWNHEFIPMTFHIIIFRLFSNIKSVKFHTSRQFFFTFENRQRHFQVVISDTHAYGNDSMSHTQNANNVFQIVKLFINVYVFVRFFFLAFFPFVALKSKR